MRERFRLFILGSSIFVFALAENRAGAQQGEQSRADPPSSALEEAGQPAAEQPSPPAATEARNEETSEAVHPPSPSNAPLPGPKYLGLYYDEDWSYLAGPPGTYEPDFFDRIKYIPLGDEWWLSIGGDLRFRLEAETNTAFGSAEPAQDTFQIYRYLLHFDLKHADTFRVFLQLGFMHDEDRDLPDRPFDENRGDLQQLFFDVKPFGGESPLTFRVGRQEMVYGKQRFVSPLDWANTRRRFDGAKLIWSEDDWQLDAFWSRPVSVQREHFDDWVENVDFYGAYFAYKGMEQHGLDVFFFGLEDNGDRVNPNGSAGDVNRFTLGSRFWGKRGPWDYEAMLAGQWGDWAGDKIEAWAWTLDGGYTFESAPWKPRAGAGFDWASGDKDPFDSSVETFDQLFPLGHAYFGYLDLIGRQNIQAFNVNLSAWPVPKRLQAYAALHQFWLQSREDAVYNAGGVAGRRDRTGESGREIGHELDLTLLWTISVHQSVLLGYSHLWAGNFIEDTGPSEDADLVYLQYRYRF